MTSRPGSKSSCSPSLEGSPTPSATSMICEKSTSSEADRILATRNVANEHPNQVESQETETPKLLSATMQSQSEEDSEMEERANELLVENPGWGSGVGEEEDEINEQSESEREMDWRSDMEHKQFLGLFNNVKDLSGYLDTKNYMIKYSGNTVALEQAEATGIYLQALRQFDKDRSELERHKDHVKKVIDQVHVDRQNGVIDEEKSEVKLSKLQEELEPIVKRIDQLVMAEDQQTQRYQKEFKQIQIRMKRRRNKWIAERDEILEKLRVVTQKQEQLKDVSEVSRPYYVPASGLRSRESLSTFADANDRDVRIGKVERRMQNIEEQTTHRLTQVEHKLDELLSAIQNTLLSPAATAPQESPSGSTGAGGETTRKGGAESSEQAPAYPENMASAQRSTASTAEKETGTKVATAMSAAPQQQAQKFVAVPWEHTSGLFGYLQGRDIQYKFNVGYFLFGVNHTRELHEQEQEIVDMYMNLSNSLWSGDLNDVQIDFMFSLRQLTRSERNHPVPAKQQLMCRLIRDMILSAERTIFNPENY